jgi:hypothetical protein
MSLNFSLFFCYFYDLLYEEINIVFLCFLNFSGVISILMRFYTSTEHLKTV